MFAPAPEVVVAAVANASAWEEALFVVSDAYKFALHSRHNWQGDRANRANILEANIVVNDFRA